MYGIHHCMNVVTGPEDSGTAVLLRALEPVCNLGDNTHGPGRLCKAMGIDLRHYGADLCGDELFLLRPPSEPAIEIVRSEEHTSELQSRGHLVCRLLLEKKKK